MIIGEAEVRIKPNTQGFSAQVESDVESPLLSTAKKAGAAFAAAIGAREVVSFFKDTVDAASDAGEEVSKTGVVFGDASEEVFDFAENAAVAFGQSETAALGAASTYGNLFRSLDLTEDKSAEMATTLTGLASDLASFNNVEVADAIDALRSGIVGETEPLKRFGVNLNAAAIEEEALRSGLIKTKDELDAAAKAQAAYSLIVQQTSLAQGDFARTADGLANQQRALNAEWVDAKTQIGEGLLPVALMFVEALRGDTIPAVTELAEAAVPLLIEGLEVALPLFGTTTDLLVAMAPALTAIASAIDAIPDPLLNAAAVGYASSKAFGGLSSVLGGVLERGRGFGSIDWSGPLDGGARAGGKFTTSLRSMTTGLSGATAAFGLGLTAVSLWTSTIEEGRRRAAEFGEGIRDDINQQIAESEDPFATLQEKLSVVRSEMEKYRDKLGGSSAPWDADFRDELSAGLDELEATDQQFSRMATTAEVLGRQYGITREEALELALSQGIDLSQGVDESKSAFEEAVGAQREAERALGNVRSESELTTEQIQEQTDALHALTDATLESASAGLDYEDSTLDTRDAIEEMIQAEKDLNAARGPDGAREVRRAELELAEAKQFLIDVQNDEEASTLDVLDAQDKVREAQGRLDAANKSGGEAYEALTREIRDAERAALDQAEAAVRVAEKAAEAEGRTLSWKDRNEILRDELDNVRGTIEPGSPLYNNLTDLIENLDRIPGTYEARVDIDTAIAQGNVDALARSLNEIYRATGSPIRISEGGGGGLTLGAAHGFFGTVSSPTPFLAGEGSGSEDVLIVPTSLGGVERVVAELAARSARTSVAGPAASVTSGRSGVTIESGAIQVIAPDTPAALIVSDTISRIGWAMTTRDDG